MRAGHSTSPVQSARRAGRAGCRRDSHARVYHPRPRAADPRPACRRGRQRGAARAGGAARRAHHAERRLPAAPAGDRGPHPRGARRQRRAGRIRSGSGSGYRVGLGMSSCRAWTSSGACCRSWTASLRCASMAETECACGLHSMLKCVDPSQGPVEFAHACVDHEDSLLIAWLGLRSVPRSDGACLTSDAGDPASCSAACSLQGPEACA